MGAAAARDARPWPPLQATSMVTQQQQQQLKMHSHDDQQLKTLVCYFYLFHFYYTNFFLIYLTCQNSNGGNSSNSSRGSRRVVPWAFGKFLFFYYTNVYWPFFYSTGWFFVTSYEYGTMTNSHNHQHLTVVLCYNGPNDGLYCHLGPSIFFLYQPTNSFFIGPKVGYSFANGSLTYPHDTGTNMNEEGDDGRCRWWLQSGLNNATCVVWTISIFILYLH